MTIKERSILLREAFPDAAKMKLSRIIGCNVGTFKRYTDSGYRTAHNKRVSKHQKKRVAKSKQKLIQLFGGGCSKCGYDACDAALDFHHVDSTQKHKDVTKLLKGSFDKALEEARKCILLCSNCHRELHEKEGTLGPNNLSEIRTRFSDIGEVGVAGAVND